MITDGESTINTADTVPNAEKVHASNLFQQVYAVGINDPHIGELNSIASDPSLVFNSNTFTSNAVKQLQQVLDLSYKLCEKVN